MHLAQQQEEGDIALLFRGKGLLPTPARPCLQSKAQVFCKSSFTSFLPTTPITQPVETAPMLMSWKSLEKIVHCNVKSSWGSWNKAPTKELMIKKKAFGAVSQRQAYLMTEQIACDAWESHSSLVTPRFLRIQTTCKICVWSSWVELQLIVNCARHLRDLLLLLTRPQYSLQITTSWSMQPRATQGN